jgi:hypothetical protein
MDSHTKNLKTLNKLFSQIIDYFSENEIALILFEINKKFRMNIIKLKNIQSYQIKEVK